MTKAERGPGGPAEKPVDVSRRDFLKGAGLTVAAVGVTGVTPV